jgi:hypothetical protein
MQKIFTAVSSFILAISIHAQDSRAWSTYYGASGGENGFSTCTDTFGNVYMAGITSSQSGMASGGFQNSFGGGNVDAYLVKFSSTGSRLWATYYGGPGDEMTFFGGKIGIAADDSGNVYLAGLTNSTSGIAANGFQNTNGGTMNAYLVKFNPAGNRVWATYYGGTLGYGYDVATDHDGNVYLAGTTFSTTGISSNGFQNASGGSSDAFLVKFNSAGNRLWATYYGGPGSDEGYRVSIDANGNIYLGGFTTSTSGIASNGFQNAYGGGGYDAFLVKFDSTGSRSWATYYGGSGDEMVLYAGDIGVETDAIGNVYLAGLTSSASGIASGGFQNTYGGGSADGFLVKFESSGGRLWSTYFGGSDNDRAYDVAVDAAGNVYIAGRTASNNAIAAGGFQNSYSGGTEMFLAKFNAAGTRLCSTYFGGSGEDFGNSLATDNAGHVYTAGGTENTTGIASGGFQNAYGGGTFDAVLVQFNTTCVTAQVEETFFDRGLNIFPNPSEGKFTITAKEMHAAELVIYDVNGQLVFSAPFDSETEIDLTGFSAGVYFIRVFDNERAFSQKIIVK